MKTLIAFLVLSGTLLAQEHPARSEGPVFDAAGWLRAYVYADGKQEQYGYDSLGRMIRFVDRNGGVTTFVYRGDGSITTIHPDGSTTESTSTR